MEVWTVGHSDRSLADFVALLRTYRIQLIADVRSVPRSRHAPQFEMDPLAASLVAEGIGYVHFAALGGWRHARPDSPNAGWRQAAFRGYADYMSTPEFGAGLEALVVAAGERRTAVMCAEAVWWRCHRRLVADALLARGIAVTHILSETKASPAALTPFARLDEGRLTYPAR